MIIPNKLANLNVELLALVGSAGPTENEQAHRRSCVLCPCAVNKTVKTHFRSVGL